MLDWLYVNENKLGICFGFCIAALLFIIVGHAYQEQIQQMLKKEICRFPKCSIDYWSIGHFCLFWMFGFFLPGYPLSAFVFGATFEFAEDYLASDGNKLFTNCSNPYRDGSRTVWCNGVQDGYWYSNMTDSWVNLTGYVIGSAIRTTFLPHTL